MSFKLTLTCFIIATVLTAQAARLRPGSLNKNDIPEDNYLAVPKDRDPERVWKVRTGASKVFVLTERSCKQKDGKISLSDKTDGRFQKYFITISKVITIIITIVITTAIINIVSVMDGLCYFYRYLLSLSS